MTFGQRLKQLRQEKGIKTQREFGRLSGLSNAGISFIESDAREPCLYTLRLIASTLDINMSKLMEGVE
jgi:transcriptional regulator with XRE-family HTH domain